MVVRLPLEREVSALTHYCLKISRAVTGYEKIVGKSCPRHLTGFLWSVLDAPSLEKKKSFFSTSDSPLESLVPIGRQKGQSLGPRECWTTPLTGTSRL